MQLYLLAVTYYNTRIKLIILEKDAHLVCVCIPIKCIHEYKNMLVKPGQVEIRK